MSGTDREPFSVENLLTWERTEIYNYDKNISNYWLPSNDRVGEFIIDLGGEISVDTIELVNTRRKRKSVKRFEVLLASNLTGGWTSVLESQLEDSREAADPGTLLQYNISGTLGRFVKFRVKSFYGNGGGLQYFSAHYSSGLC